MASSKEYLDFIMEQFMLIDDITYKKMFGEYVFYRNGKIFGGIYDDRLLIKITKLGEKIMPNCRVELPYNGGKKMFLVDNIEDREFLLELITQTCKELPFPKPKCKA